MALTTFLGAIIGNVLSMYINELILNVISGCLYLGIGVYFLKDFSK